MAKPRGSRIGSYEILGLIGVGGMGEVYRAHDTRLGRDVAIKFLPDELTLDADRRARFEREARHLASLNHANIAAIYGLEEGTDGARGLVLELVEGPTLAERLLGGALPVPEALRVAAQVAAALATAHEAGIVHRDLKPANIKLKAGGDVKVLDFGLAKTLARGLQRGGSSPPPTVTNAGATQAGTVLGTPAYMSPEQTRGGEIDRRADVWAFGCVLYELLTGRRAFAGDSVPDIVAAVLRSEPDWSLLPADLPPGVRTSLRRCLEKDPARRLRDLGDAGILIADSASRPELSGPRQSTAPGAAVRRRWPAVALAGAGALAVGAVAVAFYFRSQPDGAPAAPANPSSQPAAMPATAATSPRIAILPFENMSPDPSNAFFTDGLHEDILTALADSSPELQVISRTTMMLYRAAPKSATEVANDLAATHVLSGSVRREADAVLLTVQLIDARSDRVVWTYRYNRTLTSALMLQPEVAQQVAAQLSARVAAGPQAPLTKDAEAYDLYIKARQARRNLFGASPIEAWLDVERLLSQAIVRDPGFARAYVARSEVRISLQTNDPSDARLALARDDVAAAQRLAPRDPLTIAAEARLASDQVRRIEVIDAAERAGLTDPDLLSLKATALIRVGRVREGVELMSRLSALDPGNTQLSAILLLHLITIREPARALQTIGEVGAFAPMRAITIFYFTGNTEVLVPFSDPAFVRQVAAAGTQDPGDALRNVVDRLVVRERYLDARELIDAAAFDSIRVVLFGPFAVAGTGEMPTADLRGWTNLLLADTAEAADDGRRILEFLARTPETSANAWFRKALSADAHLFLGERAAAVADARSMLNLIAPIENSPALHAAGAIVAARVFAWAGEHAAAMDLLERLAIEEPGLPPAPIVREPIYFVPLRDDPRFRVLAERLEAQMAAWATELE